MTATQIIELQKRVGTTPDGFWGPKSTDACQRHLRSMMPSPNPWPKSSQSELTKFFGAPGDESQLTNLSVTGLGVKYDGKSVKTIRCNHRISLSLLYILEELAGSHPEILADYNGCYNFRKMRGGSSYSLHAYGAAIDFCAGTNGNKQSWPSSATMPIEVMEAFAKRGVLSSGAFWSRDAMHHQWTA